MLMQDIVCAIVVWRTALHVAAGGCGAGQNMQLLIAACTLLHPVVYVHTAAALHIHHCATVDAAAVVVQVMGILWMQGWHLGAIEGMSITSLVGLSVDFTIHLAEGHLRARTGHRRTNARCVPMLW